MLGEALISSKLRPGGICSGKKQKLPGIGEPHPAGKFGASSSKSSRTSALVPASNTVRFRKMVTPQSSLAQSEPAPCHRPPAPMQSVCVNVLHEQSSRQQAPIGCVHEVVAH